MHHVPRLYTHNDLVSSLPSQTLACILQAPEDFRCLILLRELFELAICVAWSFGSALFASFQQAQFEWSAYIVFFIYSAGTPHSSPSSKPSLFERCSLIILVTYSFGTALFVAYSLSGAPSSSSSPRASAQTSS